MLFKYYTIFITLFESILSTTVRYNISNWTPCINQTKSRVLTVCDKNYCIVVDDFDSNSLVLREKCYTGNKMMDLFLIHWYLSALIGILFLLLLKYLCRKSCPDYRIHADI